MFTLGCRLNQADTALIADDLVRHGFVIVPWGEPADLLVIDSCTVTAAAARKSRQAARAARKRQPEAFLVLAGCDAAAEREYWAGASPVDLVVGNVAKQRLSEWLPVPLQRQDRTVVVPAPCGGREEGFIEPGAGFYPARTRANLKIQEGCDFHCSYCIVPRVRGPARSRDWDDILREAEILLARGSRELVLTGVNIATYAHGGKTLADLTEALLGLDASFRLRLSSTEPGPVIRDLVALMREQPRLCRFLHIPLQYGEQRILSAMNRRYSLAAYRELVLEAAAAIPGVCIGSDIIVGFPGETEEHFRCCLETVRELPFALLHIFTYSKRAGTAAASFSGTVPGDLAVRRAEILKEAGRKKVAAFARGQVGKPLVVLTEERNGRGNWEGWSDNYLRVEIAGPVSETGGENEFVRVRIDGVEDGAQRRLRGRPTGCSPGIA